ncbi:methylamine utilization protein MauG [Sphingorhabdus soli]|uniref:Methylamine utilization protein MauG n=2 Tax=Flavisphingopyxis soli TaxID=2601267 RepID=A0A5C6UQD2_9SPHN|nr:methylamine utilization protein MauG [Sphingorhabdus soli]
MRVLRKIATANGIVRASALRIAVDPDRREAGRLIFSSNLMSVNGSISCSSCHLEKFGSADGLPNAIGVGGKGEGVARMNSGGSILPRNTLPFWGRGGKGFNTFFWDGKVASQNGQVISQFGKYAPSSDPLLVAIHLPSVELREMVADTSQIRSTFVSEDVSAADSIQSALATRFAEDSKIGPKLANAYKTTRGEITFAEVADALASFIRDEFRIQPTRLENFVFKDGAISKAELAGGIVFYGRGKCSSCHNGPYFSDLKFHAVAMPQAGFGKNGFGIDEGRYNVTQDPADRFLFRTPPLHNVTKTSPYSHSGSLPRLEDAIIAHFDPLRLAETRKMSIGERANLYARLGPASREILPSALSDTDVRDLVAFLSMLEFDTRSSVQ